MDTRADLYAGQMATGQLFPQSKFWIFFIKKINVTPIGYLKKIWM